MMAAFLYSAILDSDTLFSSLRFTPKHSLSPLWLWLKLIQSDSNSFIRTQLDDGSHLEFCHLGFSHLSFSCQTHSHLLRLVPPLAQKKLHSHFPPQHLHKKLHSFILTQLDDGSHLEFFHLGFIHVSFSCQTHSHLIRLVSPLAQKTLHSQFPPHHLHKKLHLFILTQLDVGSHLEFCHVVFSHCHLGFRHLVIFSQIHSKTLSLHSDSDWN